ncbi:hypothetical protein COCOBI_02-0380 [Coccomyxa sp. Obi]|nr:hypothetical protein COCOBI_02-0380 [Coccomyxa sp. Obi]
MESERLGHVSLERLAGAGAARVRLQPAAPVKALKAELTQEDIVEEPEWPSLTYDEVVDARPTELAQRWPPRLGRGRRRDMSASDVAALQNEVLTRTALQPEYPANCKGKGPSNKRPRADEPSEPNPLEGSTSDSEHPAPPEPSSSNSGSGSPPNSSVPTAATDSVPHPLIAASQEQGTFLRRSKRLRVLTGSPTLEDEPGIPGRGPAMVNKPAVTPPAAAQNRSVGASQEQGTSLRRSKRLRGQTGSPIPVDELGSPEMGPATVTKPAVTPSAAAESESAGTCREKGGQVRRHWRGKTGSHGAGGGSHEASAASGPSADTSLYTWPKRRLASGSAEQDAAADGSEAADGRAVGKKRVPVVPEDLSARVTAILANSDLHQMTMRQVMERLQENGGLEVSAKLVKGEVDRYLMQLQGTSTDAVQEGTASQDSEDTLWKVSIEDELNTDFRDLRPSAASRDEERASLSSQLELAADTPPDLQAAALALHWALISLAGAHRRAARPAAPAPSAGMADDDLACSKPMSHPDSGANPAAAEPSAGAPADMTSTQPMSQRPLEAPLAAANARDTGAAAAVAGSASQETDQAAPQAGLLSRDLPARPEVVGELAQHGTPSHDAHLLRSAGGCSTTAGEGAEVSEPGSVDHAAEQAVPDAAADGAAGDPSPDAEDEHLDRSVSRAADNAFGLAYSILERLLARRWTEDLRPHFGPTSRLSFSLPQLARFGAAWPPRPSAAPTGAKSGPAAGGPSPTTAGDPSPITEGGPSYQAESPSEPLEAGNSIRHGPAPGGESTGHLEGSGHAGDVQHIHAGVPHSSGSGRRDAVGGTHLLEDGGEETQQQSVAEAPYSSIAGDARLVFEAAAAAGVGADVISRAVQQYQRLVHGNAEKSLV